MEGCAIVCAGCAESKKVLSRPRYRFAEELKLQIAMTRVQLDSVSKKLIHSADAGRPTVTDMVLLN
jgi:hypothetical protein